MNYRLAILVVAVSMTIGRARKPKKPDYETQEDMEQGCASIVNIRSYHSGLFKGGPHLTATLRNGCDTPVSFLVRIVYYDKNGNQASNAGRSTGYADGDVAPGQSFDIVHWVCGSPQSGDCDASNYKLRPGILNFSALKTTR